MSYGSLKSLYLALQASPPLQANGKVPQVQILFGEENIDARDQALPYVTMVPTDDVAMAGGGAYAYNIANDTNAVWGFESNVDLYLWDYATHPDAINIDHVDAVENLRARVLQAFQAQTTYGVMFHPLRGRWQSFQNGDDRLGRAYVLSVTASVTVVDAPWNYATITKETINPVTLVKG